MTSLVVDATARLDFSFPVLWQKRKQIVCTEAGCGGRLGRGILGTAQSEPVRSESGAPAQPHVIGLAAA